MNKITTHILDISEGKPAQGVTATLEIKSEMGWEEIGTGITDDDGRIKDIGPDAMNPGKGLYRLRFDTASYFKKHHKNCFHPSVTIEFEITDGSHYHVPLLLSPFGYSTYRGS